jgi:hypothetical protein
MIKNNKNDDNLNFDKRLFVYWKNVNASYSKKIHLMVDF